MPVISDRLRGWLSSCSPFWWSDWWQFICLRPVCLPALSLTGDRAAPATPGGHFNISLTSPTRKKEFFLPGSGHKQSKRQQGARQVLQGLHTHHLCAGDGDWGQEEKGVHAPVIWPPNCSGHSWFSKLPDVGCDKPTWLSNLFLWMWCPEGVFPRAGADLCTELACTYKVAEQINSVGTKLRL